MAGIISPMYLNDSSMTNESTIIYFIYRYKLAQFLDTFDSQHVFKSLLENTTVYAQFQNLIEMD
jgi:hypothetical protein